MYVEIDYVIPLVYQYNIFIYEIKAITLIYTIYQQTVTTNKNLVFDYYENFKQ